MGSQPWEPLMGDSSDFLKEDTPFLGADGTIFIRLA